MKNCTSVAGEQFLQRVDEANARELVFSAISAAKEQVQYARALNAARRAVILLRKRNAGRIHELEAKMHYQNRNSQLRYVKHSFAKLLKDINENQEKRCAEFFSRGGLNEVAAYARQTVILRLLNSDIKPAEARRALRELDTTLGKLKGLTSLTEIDNYLQQHLDELIEKKMGNPGLFRGLCVFLLVLTSLFAILVLIAALICAFTFGLVCEGLLDRLIDQSCGSS